MSRDIRLRPSTAFRWQSCTAWPALDAKIDPPDIAGPSAREGTCLHEHMENMIRFGAPLGGCAEGHAEAVTAALNLYRRHIDREGMAVETETPIALDFAGHEITGTIDLLGWHPKTKTLVVVDWKFGERYAVRAEENEQLLLYAMGGYKRAAAKKVEVERVEMWIVQPRLPLVTEPEYWALDASELIARAVDVRRAVDDIMAGRVEYAPTESNCRWCGVRNYCSAAKRAELKLDTVEETARHFAAYQ